MTDEKMDVISAGEERPLIDPGNAPTVYVSEVVGAFKESDNFIITLGATQLDHATEPAALKRMIVLRLVMSDPVLANALDFLARTRATFKQMEAAAPEPEQGGTPPNATPRTLQ